MITHLTLEKSEYEEILNRGILYAQGFGPEWRVFPNIVLGWDWLMQRYTRVNGNDYGATDLFAGDIYDRTIEDITPNYRADHEYVRLTLNIPDEIVMPLRSGAYHSIANTSFCPLNSDEYEAFHAEWEEKTKAAGVDWRRIDVEAPVCQDYLQAIHESYERSFNPDTVYDIEYCGEDTWLPMFPVIKIDWINSAVHFRGTEYSQFIGPNKVDASTIPPLEGYGDSISVGDQFTERMESSSSSSEPLTLVGWEMEGKWVHVIALKDDDSLVSFNANCQDENRVFSKIV